MECDITRGAVRICAPTVQQHDWIATCLAEEEIWSAFALSGPDSQFAVRAEAAGAVVAVIQRTSDNKTIGFIIVCPPSPKFMLWEFCYAIPEAEHRDAFSALSSTDAMAHYLFEIKGIDALAWRVRQDNRAAAAVVRRLGYRKHREWVAGGIAFDLFCLGPEDWRKRKERLKRSRRSDGPLFDVNYRD